MSLKHLVLIGAGHAHLQVLQSLARKRAADTDVVLVSPYANPVSSRMVPGVITGHHALCDCRVDLKALLQAGGVRHVQGWCSAVDARNQTVTVSDGQGASAQLHYQLLSLATGRVPDRARLEQAMPGARNNAMFMRPLEVFLELWPKLLALGRTRPLSLVVIGSDRQAVDLAFALQFALPGSRVTLLSGGAEPGSDCAAALRQRILRQLRLQGITVLQERCVGIESDQVLLGSGATLACDAPLVACGDEPPAWLQASGLALDDAGLVRVNAFQQSSSHGNVFAGGDIASRVDLAQPQQRRHGPREGLALDFNLRAVLADSALKPYRPASQTLDLISYGDRQAIAGWGEFCVQGRWVWYLRDALEQRELRQMSRR